MMNEPMQSTPSVALPTELLELVLVSAIRSIHTFDPRQRQQDSTAIHALLSVLPSTVLSGTYLIRAALMQMWWVDVDYASARNCVLVLDVMVSMAKPRVVRPLQYSQAGLVETVKLGHVDVIDWWYKQRAAKVLYFNNVEWTHVRGGIGHAATEAMALHLFKWAIRTLLDLDPDSDFDPLPPPEDFLVDTCLTVVDQAMLRGFQSIVLLATRVQSSGLNWWNAPLVQPVAANQDKWMVEWAVEHFREKRPTRTSWESTGSPGYHIVRGAVETGNKNWIRWAMQVYEKERAVRQDPPMPTIHHVLLRSLFIASEAGQLDVVQWILEDPELNQGLDTNGKLPDGCTWINMGTIALAGHLHILEWWSANAERLGACLSAGTHAAKTDSDLLHELAKKGNMAIVTWWLQQPHFTLRPTTLKNLPLLAAEHGLIDLLEYCNTTPSLKKKVTFSTEALTVASKHGHVEVLRWWKANKKRMSCHEDTLIAATQGGHLDVLDWWLDESGFKQLHSFYRVQVLSFALLHGQLDALDWWLQSELLDGEQVQRAMDFDFGNWNQYLRYHPSVVRYVVHHRLAKFGPSSFVPNDDDDPTSGERWTAKLLTSDIGQPILLHFLHSLLGCDRNRVCELLNTEDVLSHAIKYDSTSTLKWVLTVLQPPESTHQGPFSTVTKGQFSDLMFHWPRSKAVLALLIDSGVSLPLADVDKAKMLVDEYPRIEQWMMDRIESHKAS